MYLTCNEEFLFSCALFPLAGILRRIWNLFSTETVEPMQSPSRIGEVGVDVDAFSDRYAHGSGKPAILPANTLTRPATLSWSCRRTGKILYANQAAAAAYGYNREELLASSIIELRAADTQYLVTDQLKAALSSGALSRTQHRRKNGDVFPVEVSAKKMSSPASPPASVLSVTLARSWPSSRFCMKATRNSRR